LSLTTSAMALICPTSLMLIFLMRIPISGLLKMSQNIVPKHPECGTMERMSRIGISQTLEVVVNWI
jgi:hypothetical protein